MASPLSLAVVGCGAIADSYYFPVLSKDPILREATWLVEPATSRAGGLAEKYGFRRQNVVASVAELPDHVAVAINATPSHLHVSTTLPLLQRGASVLLEKPFAEFADDAETILEAGGTTSKLSVNHFRRLTPSYALVRELIRSGRLGTVHRIDWQEGHKFDWPTQSGFNFRRPWPKGRPRGALLDIGVHALDAITWWLGEPLIARSAIMDGYGGPEAFVRAELATRETQVRLTISFLEKLTNQFVVEGSRASIRGGTSSFDQIEMRTEGGPWKLIAAKGSAQRFDIGDRLVRNFLAAVRGDEPLLIEAASVVPVLSAIDRIYDIASPQVPTCYKEWGL